MKITKKYLESLNPTCYGDPENFGDYHIKKAKILKLADALANLGFSTVGVSFEQDSNHYASISVDHGSLRFSRFDDLLVITHEERFPVALLRQVVEEVRNHGYIFVPWHFFGKPFATRERFNGDLFNQLFDWQ